MSFQKIAELPLDKDLSQLARWLTAKKVPYRIVEEKGLQCIYVQQQFALDMQGLVLRFLQDGSVEEKMRADLRKWSLNTSTTRWHMVTRPVSAPFVVSLIIACALVALFTGLGGGGPLLRALVFADPFQVVDDTFAQRLEAITFNLENYQWWRFFTPAILHFSVLHIVFNMLWLWYLGAMVEIKQGRLRMVMLFALTALVSNAAQYLQTGPLFGGMSGVVYGLVGYCWLWDKRHPSIFKLPDALMGFMLVWLVLGYVGVMESLPGVGAMANTAHLVGLVTGTLLALLPPARGNTSKM